MRFVRHAQIFRGSLDSAPLASVLMLLVMFVMVCSLTYTPGVLVDLGQPIIVTKTNAVLFSGKVYLRTELDQLRSALKAAPIDAGFSVMMQPGANAELGQQVSNLFQIKLAEGKNLVGTDNATAIVSVNFRGQFFYENQLVTDSELKSALASQLQIAHRAGREFTLIVYVDKATESQVEAHLDEIAREAGVRWTQKAQRPAGFGGQL